MFLLIPLYKLKVGNDFKLLKSWCLDYANMTINVFSLVGQYLYFEFVCEVYFLQTELCILIFPVT